mmetsp:Transcript_16826/g.36475  ORF Transcript_16826/g.36475 Transcript_16826/m.36475 type:complete len:215 (+) Transcript_16826:131-775(+)
MFGVVTPQLIEIIFPTLISHAPNKTNLIQRIYSVLLNVLFIPVHKIFVRRPLIDHPPVQLLHLLRALRVARDCRVPVVLLLPRHEREVHVVPPTRLPEPLLHDLLAELRLEPLDLHRRLIIRELGGRVLGLRRKESRFGRGEVDLLLLLVHFGLGEEVLDGGVVHLQRRRFRMMVRRYVVHLHGCSVKERRIGDGRSMQVRRRRELEEGWRVLI